MKTKQKILTTSLLVGYLSCLIGCAGMPTIGQDVQMNEKGVFVSIATSERFTGDALVPLPPKKELLSQRCGNSPVTVRIQNGVQIASKYSQSPFAKWVLEPIDPNTKEKR